MSLIDDKTEMDLFTSVLQILRCDIHLQLTLVTLISLNVLPCNQTLCFHPVSSGNDFFNLPFKNFEKLIEETGCDEKLLPEEIVFDTEKIRNSILVFHTFDGHF